MVKIDAENLALANEAMQQRSFNEGVAAALHGKLSPYDPTGKDACEFSERFVLLMAELAWRGGHKTWSFVRRDLEKVIAQAREAMAQGD